MHKNEIIKKLLELLSPRLKKIGITADELDKDLSLLNQGVYDSLGFIEFIAGIEELFDIEFDFDEMDATDFTSLNQLVEIIAGQKTSKAK